MNRKKLINVAFIICSFVSLACIALYFVNFHSMPISQKTSDWSNFGSYIAGTIGPLMSLVSILFIIKSINITNDNHHELMEFSITDKLHNHIKDLTETLSESLTNDFVFKQDSPSLRPPCWNIMNTLGHDVRFKRANYHLATSSYEDIARNVVSNQMFDFCSQIKLIRKLIMLLNKLTPTDRDIYKLLIETKISGDQRTVMYCFACKDLPEDAEFINEQWPSFRGSIFND